METSTDVVMLRSLQLSSVTALASASAVVFAGTEFVCALRGTPETFANSTQ